MRHLILLFLWDLHQKHLTTIGIESITAIKEFLKPALRMIFMRKSMRFQKTATSFMFVCVLYLIASSHYISEDCRSPKNTLCDRRSSLPGGEEKPNRSSAKLSPETSTQFPAVLVPPPTTTQFSIFNSRVITVNKLSFVDKSKTVLWEEPENKILEPPSSSYGLFLSYDRTVHFFHCCS